MNISKITVNSKEYSLLFGYTCYTEFMTRCFMFKDTYLTQTIELEDGKTEGGELTGLGLANLFHSAYLSNCYDRRQSIVLRFDDFAEWISEKYKTTEGAEEIAKVLEVWAASKEIKALKEEVDKKKVMQEETNLQNPPLTT